MVDECCGFDCPACCGDRECHYLRQLPDGTSVAVWCRGTCSGRCAGRLEVENAAPLRLPAPTHDVRPDRRARATVRSRELFFEPNAERGGDLKTYEVSCAVGCFVRHGAEATGGPADCYGSCLGICYGVATYQEVAAPTSRGHS